MEFEENQRMNDISITIPGEALAAVKIPRQRLQAELRKELAVQLYREGLVSGAGATRIAGIEKTEFQYLLGQRGVCQQYDDVDYRKDVDNLRKWQANA